MAQLLGEMCDGGTICNTEPNSLRESVEVSSVLGKLFTQVGLPGYTRTETRRLFKADFLPDLRLLWDHQATLPRVSGQRLHRQMGLRFRGGGPMFDIPPTSSTLTLLRSCLFSSPHPVDQYLPVLMDR